MSPLNQEYFVQHLLWLHERFHSPEFNLEHYSQKVMDAFLKFGSETPGNINCHEHVHFGTLTGEGTKVELGFKAKDKPVFVYHVLNTLYGMPIAEPLHDHYPELSQAEWKAALLMASKVVRAFSLIEMRHREPSWNVASQYFARKLCSLYDSFDYPSFDAAQYNHRVMTAFMKFDWGNPGNENAYDKVEFAGSMIPHFEGTFYGFKIKGKPIFVHDILNQLEVSPLPLSELREVYLELYDNELDALLRMATMLVAAFSPVTPK